MTTATQGVFWGRDDTMLGVCEAIGNDFGFNPLWLRIAFALPMAFFPIQTIGVYLLLGAFVAASRLIAPVRKTASTAEVIPLPAPAAANKAASESTPELALAA